MKFCEMNRKLYRLLQWALTYPAHDFICRPTPLFGPYLPKMKSGQWNLNILLIRKQKRIRCFLTSPPLQRTLCRKGPKGFCKMHNKEHDCPWVWVLWGPQAGTEAKQPSQGQSGSGTPSPACPSTPAGSYSFPPHEQGNNIETSHCNLPGFQDMLCAVCLCHLFLILQYLQLLQEWFLTSKSAQGLAFTTR